MGAFASGGARAVLIGTGTYAELPDLPSVHTTLDDLAVTLVEVCGMAADNVVRVPATATASDVLTVVEDAIGVARGPALVYYVGHGLLGPGDKLYLATSASRAAGTIADAVAFRTVRDLLGGATAGGVVVLDCCFSGRADAPGHGVWHPYPSARPRGGYLVSSATNYGLAFAPEGERHTRFTGVLLRALTDGDPAGPLWLTLDRLYTLTANGSRRQSDGSLGELVIARNRAYRTDRAEAEPPADVPCPYPGLEAFRIEDSEHFHGREDVVERMLDAVAKPEPVVLVGASGVGKSSLLRAGLLAGLERRYEAGAEVSWPALLLPAPGQSPLRALAELLAPATGRPVEQIRTELDKGRFPETACQLLVVDQFEEVFTRCEDADEIARFIAVLLAAPRVVLSVRADHYGRCLAHQTLERALDEGQLTVVPMREQALRAAVERPAAAVGLTLEDGLTDRLIHDLREGGDGATAALPFLAHVLRETWLRRNGTRLTLAGYQDTGGIWKAVATTTEDLHDSLDESERRALRQLLLRMVHVTPDAVALRHDVPANVVLDGVPTDEKDATLQVRHRLADARLITVDEDTVRISHEALLQGWPKLREWIDEDRATLLLRQQLEAAADAWNEAESHPDFLARGERLDGLLAVAEAQPVRELDRRFLARSKDAARKEHEEDLRRTRLLSAHLRVAVIGLCVALVAAVVAVYQWQEANDRQQEANEQRQLANFRALMAQAENVAADRPALAQRLALSANKIHPSPEAVKAVFDTLAGTRFLGSAHLRTDVIENPVFSHSGRTVATFDTKGATLWDVSAANELSALPCPWTEDNRTFSFSPDDRYLALTCGARIEIWQTAGSEQVATFRADDLSGDPEAVEFSPDGGMLAVTGWQPNGGPPGALTLWDLHDPRGPRRLATRTDVYEGAGIAFSPDGRTLALATDWSFRTDEYDFDSGVSLWNIADPTRPAPLTRVNGWDGKVRFSPDGRLLATTSSGKITVWRMADPAKPELFATWSAHPSGLSEFAFSPDGTTIAAGAMGGPIGLWDIRSNPPRQRLTLTEHDYGIFGLSFAPDSATLVSLDGDGTVITWQTAGNRRPTIVSTLSWEGGPVAFTPDGEALATSGASVGELCLWDLTNPGNPVRTAFTGVDSRLAALAVSGDGRLLAAGYDNGTIMLWDVTNRASPSQIFVHDSGVSVASLAFGPDTTLAVLHGGSPLVEGTVVVWNVGDPRAPHEVRRFTGLNGSGAVQFGADGRLLAMPILRQSVYLTVWDRWNGREPRILYGIGAEAALSSNRQIIAGREPDSNIALMLWNVADLRHPKPMGHLATEVGSPFPTPYAFHPADSLVAGPGDDGMAALWNADDLWHPYLVATFDQHSDYVRDLEFSANGRLLATAGGDRINIWDLGAFPEIAADTIGMACDVAGGGLSTEEWDTYVVGMPYQKAC